MNLTNQLEFLERYKKIKMVGEGGYGQVYKATEKATGNLVALKKMKLEIGYQGVPETTLREISLLKMLRTSFYIVPLHSVELIGDTSTLKCILILVFEYLDTDLKKYMDLLRRGPNSCSLSPSCIQSFLYQLCMGVEYCHRHGVLHRDLKPQNLLVDQLKGILKIADFGEGRTFTYPLRSYTPRFGTLCYRAPEVLLGSAVYSTGVDMWSVVCIFAEMVKRGVLFHGDSEFQLLVHIFRLLGTPTEEVWPGVTSLWGWHVYPEWRPLNLALVVPELGPDGVDLLSKMLKYNPAERISAIEALDHPYFNSLDKSQF